MLMTIHNYTLQCLSLISYKNLSQHFLLSGKTTANWYSHNNGNKIDFMPQHDSDSSIATA